MRTQEPVAREGWILDEDFALRQKLQGMSVSDSVRKDRKVGVWFGHPDQELRAQNYPYLTVDLVDISEELDRAERGWYQVNPYDALSAGLIDEQPRPSESIFMDVPLPIRLTYQISTFSRNPRHDRQLLTQLIRDRRIPLQGGALYTHDGTNRRLDVLDFSKRDSVEQNKRLLSNVLIVAVSSEVPWKTIIRASRVSSIWATFRAVMDTNTGEIDIEEGEIIHEGAK